MMSIAQMLNLDLLANSEGRPTLVNREAIQHALGEIQESQRAFIELCLQEDPAKRPKASTLLKHAVLQEVSYICTIIPSCYGEWIFIYFVVVFLQIFTLKVLSTLALSHREPRENVEVLVGKINGHLQCVVG